jgi:aminoglycoside phosphotransferase (APT) family kinase protein
VIDWSDAGIGDRHGDIARTDAWAMAVAGEQGFFGPSHAGFDSGIATWAEEHFWLCIEDLP